MPTAIELAAAQLALLAARASISRQVKIRGPRIRMPPTRERLAPETVVERLAAAPKPISVEARETGGSIEVRYRPLLPGSHEFEWHEGRLALNSARGGVLGPTITRHRLVPTEVRVQCVGRHEALLLPLAAVERWHDDYEIMAVTLRGDDVANPLCSDWPEYIEAKRLGAAGIMIFSSPQDNPIRAVITMRDDE